MKITVAGDQTNIVLEEGIPHAIVASVLDDSGNPVDLTGHRIVWQARRSFEATEVLLDKSTDNGGIVNSGTSGIFTINIGETELVDLDWLNAIHDVKIVGLLRPFQGTISIARQVAI